MRLAARLALRARQLALSLLTRPDAAVDAELRRRLGSAARWRLLARLTPYDRAHHLRVYQHLRAQGWDDPDVLLAALLHDAGKADERGRATPLHRALLVLLRRLAPGALERLAQPARHGLLHGLYLARHHARLGAELARATGAGERACWLIAHHDARPLPPDPALAALVAADETVTC